MSKRRLVNAAAEEETDEEGEESPEERRNRRDRERRSKKKKSSRPGSGLFAGRPRWVKATAVVGVIVAIAAAILVISLFLAGPCPSISPPPATSGVPSESSWSWCVNSTDAIVEEVNVHLAIVVGGTPVTIPGGIGELPSGHFVQGSSPSPACNMPIFTDNSTGNGVAGSSDGYIWIVTPWPFEYTLADFFSVWHDSYADVSVGGTQEPVSYTGTQLFNYTSNSAGTQVVTLWIDGTAQTAPLDGPNTVLNYYQDSQYASSENPQSCASKYGGSNHSLVITWGYVGAGETAGGASLFQTSGNTEVILPPDTVPLGGWPSTALQVSMTVHPGDLTVPRWATAYVAQGGPPPSPPR